MNAAVKSLHFKYWEQIAYYADSILWISHNSKSTMDGMQAKFKFKRDKIETLTQYLGASLSKIIKEDGAEYKAISSDAHCTSLVNLHLLIKCRTPIKNCYKPELDATAELKQDRAQ